MVTSQGHDQTLAVFRHGNTAKQRGGQGLEAARFGVFGLFSHQLGMETS